MFKSIIFAAASLALFAGPALAQEPPEVPVVAMEAVADESMTNEMFFEAAIKVVQEATLAAKEEGLGKMTIAVIVLLAFSQILVQLTKTKMFFQVFKNVGDQGKLLIVSICSVITTWAPLYLAGVPWYVGLTSSGVVAALMVAGHQVYKHFFAAKK